MRKFGKVKAEPPENPTLAVSTGTAALPFGALSDYNPPPQVTGDLFSALREAIPVIDAAVDKLVRLVGGFTVTCADARYQPILDAFLQSVPADSGSVSLQAFADTFFESLLTYGTAVAEILPDQTGAVRYLYNAPHKAYTLRRNPKQPCPPLVYAADKPQAPLPRQENLLVCTLNAKPGSLYGTPLLAGLPFTASILLKILHATGQNWERVGNVRFAVTYKPSDDAAGKAFAKERAMQIAEQWQAAMHSREARDFIAVGDVDIQTIGADNQILDSEVPVRQLLEQIVAKLSIPPYMLGLSWSTTERMAAEQADLLTTELRHYRRLLTPVLEAVCRMHLRAFGYTGDLQIVWEDILLRDAVEDATARHLDAQTAAILAELPQADA